MSSTWAFGSGNNHGWHLFRYRHLGPNTSTFRSRREAPVCFLRCNPATLAESIPLSTQLRFATYARNVGKSWLRVAQSRHNQIRPQGPTRKRLLNSRSSCIMLRGQRSISSSNHGWSSGTVYEYVAASAFPYVFSHQIERQPISSMACASK